MNAPRRAGAARAGTGPQPAAGRAPGHRGPLRTPAFTARDAAETVVQTDAAAVTPAESPGRSPRGGSRGGGNRLTGRATALFVVLAMLAVAYTWPVKEYLRQHGELSRLRAQSSATQAHVDALEALKQRWADPAYVKAQARARLHFVLPGETAYVVLQPDRPAAPQTLPKQTAQILPAWYTELWDSVRGADQPTQH